MASSDIVVGIVFSNDPRDYGQNFRISNWDTLNTPSIFPSKSLFLFIWRSPHFLGTLIMLQHISSKQVTTLLVTLFMTSAAEFVTG